MVKRGHKECEPLLHIIGAVGEGLAGPLGKLSKGGDTIDLLPDVAPKLVEADPRVRHQPPQVVPGSTQPPRSRLWTLCDDPTIPIGPPLGEPMGYAVQDLGVEAVGHVVERDRWSGSHTSSTSSSG